LLCHPEHRHAGSGGYTRIHRTTHPPSRRDACSTRGGFIKRPDLWGSRLGCRVVGRILSLGASNASRGIYGMSGWSFRLRDSSSHSHRSFGRTDTGRAHKGGTCAAPTPHMHFAITSLTPSSPQDLKTSRPQDLTPSCPSSREHWNLVRAADRHLREAIHQM
jgi:hypothetical protein